jgi:hypothetical protein
MKHIENQAHETCTSNDQKLKQNASIAISFCLPNQITSNYIFNEKVHRMNFLIKNVMKLLHPKHLNHNKVTFDALIWKNLSLQ